VKTGAGAETNSFDSATLRIRRVRFLTPQLGVKKTYCNRLRQPIQRSHLSPVICAVMFFVCTLLNVIVSKIVFEPD
jgi:hypothetical protein